jgi:ketosteroid isomerase-like protein
MNLSVADKQNIETAYVEMMKRMMALDWAGFAEMCTDDMIHVTGDAQVFQAQGKQSLHDRLAETMGDLDALEIEYSIREINGDGNCAYVLSPNKDILKFSGSDAPLIFDNCQTLSVLERQADNSWKLKLQMCIVAENSED